MVYIKFANSDSNLFFILDHDVLLVVIRVRPDMEQSDNRTVEITGSERVSMNMA